MERLKIRLPWQKGTDSNGKHPAPEASLLPDMPVIDHAQIAKGLEQELTTRLHKLVQTLSIHSIEVQIGPRRGNDEEYIMIVSVVGDRHFGHVNYDVAKGQSKPNQLSVLMRRNELKNEPRYIAVTNEMVAFCQEKKFKIAGVTKPELTIDDTSGRRSQQNSQTTYPVKGFEQGVVMISGSD